MKFEPKCGGDAWRIRTSEAIASGYDVVVMLDRVPATADSGWMLELGIDSNGSVSGQITAHPGFDALAVFTCSQDTLAIGGNDSLGTIAISDADHGQHTASVPPLDSLNLDCMDEAELVRLHDELRRLAAYAWSKADCMRRRREGDITGALKGERNLEHNYARLPESWRW